MTWKQLFLCMKEDSPMTELEKIKRAKIYMDKLANGINPLDDSDVPESSLINDVRLARCFFFVSEVLQRSIQVPPSEPKKKRGKVPFSITQAQLHGFPYSDVPVSVSQIIKALNLLAADDNMLHLKYSDIASWLIEVGLLKPYTTTTGRNVKRPTEQGKAQGITIVERDGMNGPYKVVVYDRNAQQLIVDNLIGLLEARQG